MKNSEWKSETEDEIRLRERKKERTRQYLIEVADLSLLIVEELREKTEGLSIDAISEIIPGYSSETYVDAIESAVEDEYIEMIDGEDGLELYRAIIYDEFD
jgi:hypothetical protein